MYIPKELNILGQKVTVSENSLNSEAYGQYAFGPKVITVDSSMCDDHSVNKQQILLHEVIHAVMHRVGLYMVIDSKLEEIICESVSKTITENFTLSKPKRTR